ncbi:MAG TPA: DUF4340 domain-containing protein [Clostridiales bacterium]|nr:DUF4340 domain-containing protein [Clostridiales bacterium]
MKLYRNAIILVIILALLFGVYAFAKNQKSKTEVTERKSFEKIIDLDTTEMEELTVQKGSDKLTIAKKDKEWELKYPEGIRYDSSKLSSIAINFSSVFIEKEVEENATDFEQYGLDKPIIVSAKMKDGKVETLEIGNLTPTGGAYYVKKKDSSKVYTTDTYTINKVIVGKNDIRDVALFTIESTDITKISMERKGSVVFEANINSEENNWTLTSPIKGNANISALSPMLDAITQSQITEFVEENPSDLEKYGLAKPSYVLEFESSQGENRLLLGKEISENAKVYAMLDGVNEVYTISSEPFNFLDKPIEEIVEVFAYIVNIWDVEKINVEMDGYNLNLELQTDPDQDTDKDKFFVNGKDASMKDENDRQPFRSYYQSLIGVTLSQVQPDGQPSVKPDITFTYYLKKDPKVMKVEFIPKDDRYYYVVKNGEYSGILVDKKKFDEPEGVRESYAKLMETLKKAETAQ